MANDFEHEKPRGLHTDDVCCDHQREQQGLRTLHVLGRGSRPTRFVALWRSRARRVQPPAPHEKFRFMFAEFEKDDEIIVAKEYEDGWAEGIIGKCVLCWRRTEC